MAEMEQATIKLDQFLKLQGLVGTGGHAKMLIQSGEVQVNGTVELRRGRKLCQGDRITTLGTTVTVDLEAIASDHP
jgi:ribosome-associated protein